MANTLVFALGVGLVAATPFVGSRVGTRAGLAVAAAAALALWSAVLCAA